MPPGAHSAAFGFAAVVVLILEQLLLELDPDFGSFVFIYAVVSQFIFGNVQK